jgi:hypothetical protein
LAARGGFLGSPAGGDLSGGVTWAS